jgi:hypothetical protein
MCRYLAPRALSRHDARVRKRLRGAVVTAWTAPRNKWFLWRNVLVVAMGLGFLVGALAG